MWNTFNQVPMRISRYIKKNSNSSIPCCIQFWNTLGTQVLNTKSIKTTTINIIQYQNNIWTVKIKFLVKGMNFWNENSSFLLLSMVIKLLLCRTLHYVQYCRPCPCLLLLRIQLNSLHTYCILRVNSIDKKESIVHWCMELFFTSNKIEQILYSRLWSLILSRWASFSVTNGIF